MKIILDLIKEIISQMSLVSFLVSFLGLLSLEIISYLVGMNTKNNKSIKNNSDKLSMRIFEFIVFSSGIAICFLGYWFIKEFKATNQIVTSDILFPIVIFFMGKVMYYLIKKINGIEIGNNEDDEFDNNRRFLMLITLICFIIIGFIAKNKSINTYSTNTGLLITAVIIGRFLWFDTTWESFKDDISKFKPTKSYFKEVVTSVLIVILGSIYIITREENIVYGVFAGLTLGVILTVVVLLYLKLKNRYQEKVLINNKG